MAYQDNGDNSEMPAFHQVNFPNGAKFFSRPGMIEATKLNVTPQIIASLEASDAFEAACLMNCNRLLHSHVWSRA